MTDLDDYTSRTAAGSAMELVAAVHLMRQGYHVFRSLAPTCPVDLVAMKDAKLLRVEVKRLSEKPASDDARVPSFTWPKNDEWDLLLVTNETEVWEFTPEGSREDAIDRIRAAWGMRQLVRMTKRSKGIDLNHVPTTDKGLTRHQYAIGSIEV